jgi:FKBP-type peptidyl-prolyl cis-trans isomerase
MSVVKEVLKAGNGPQVTKDYRYKAHVTLYIEKNGQLTPSGWSTAGGAPFEFRPFENLIQGWSEGVVQMKEGERAKLHVPAAKGYGPKEIKSPSFHVPSNSDLCFDIEILGRV